MPYSSSARRQQRQRSRRQRRLAHKAKPVGDASPSIKMCKSMPHSYRGMNNTSLSTLGSMENHVALEEMLKRHIMATDDVSYQEASLIFLKIEEKNHEFKYIMAFPFQVSIFLCLSAGLVSIPLVFHLPTVEYFNEHFVTAEHPQPKDLDTALEVGSWSWNWMEPVLGTSTFVLLCLQYMRLHLNHLGVRPFTYRMKKFRSQHLAKAFPQYSEDLLIAYSESSPFFNPKDLWF